MSYNNYAHPAQAAYQQHMPYGQPQQLYQQQPQQSALRNSSSQLWMGELDPFWDEMFIKTIWENLGFPQVNVKIIKDTKTGATQAYNSGYCFIEFPNLDLASSALSKNGARIPNTNRSLKLNWASGGSSVSTPRVNGGNEISIFVGDLAPEVTESALFEFFGTKYPSVSATKIMIDQQTGQSKGYGFVRFLNEAEQQRALTEMQGAVLNGRPIRVSTAVPKNRPQNQFQQRHSFNGATTTGFPQPAAGQTGQPFMQSPQTQQIMTSIDSQYQPPLNQFTDPNNTTVFIGGLSSIVTEEDLRLYFQPFGDITYVKIPVGKGCGFVQYTTRASAELAISKMQGYPIGNSRIRLSWGRSNANPKPQQYRPQTEMPVMFGYEQQPMVPQVPQQGAIPGLTGEYGVSQIEAANQFTSEPSENNGAVDQNRLNQLYLAARDGRLDAIDAGSNGYIFA